MRDHHHASVEIENRILKVAERGDIEIVGRLIKQEYEGDSKVRWFEGNFEAYQETRKKELGGREENRRSKYKKLTIR